jgi:hypothetical protein
MEGYGRGQQVARRPLLTPVSVYMSAVGGSSEMTDLRPKRANDYNEHAGHSSRSASILQRTTLTWPSGQSLNSAIRLKPAFSYIAGAWKS